MRDARRLIRVVVTGVAVAAIVSASGWPFVFSRALAAAADSSATSTPSTISSRTAGNGSEFALAAAASTTGGTLYSALSPACC